MESKMQNINIEENTIENGSSELSHEENKEITKADKNSTELNRSILNQLNEFSTQVRNKLGPFIYRKRSRANLQFRDIVVRENDCKYLGQWNEETNLREGVGILVWKSGSIYEGYWKNDMANGKGRLIHANGDVYEGDWINDKPNGKGLYLHFNGGDNYGDWNDDRQHGLELYIIFYLIF